MTPCFRCRAVVTGNSVNKGPFREEGIVSTRRWKDDKRTMDELRTKFEQDAIDAFNDVTQWHKNPKYEGVTDLKVELGEIEVIGG